MKHSPLYYTVRDIARLVTLVVEAVLLLSIVYALCLVVSLM
jgi:hypothetical protein